MTEHTPGPWTIRHTVVRDAHSRLIAAAPELLAACEEALPRLENHRLLNHLKWHRGQPDSCADCAAEWGEVAQVRAAIAKAKGEALNA